jgi:hypothetical protein
MISPVTQLRPPGPARRPAPVPARIPARRGAFTLAELAVSLGLVSVLLLAMGSVMVVSGRAVAVSATHAGEAKVDDAVAAIASEQRLALEILERSQWSVTFRVPDRDNDGAPETIRYVWSGTAGDSLMRTYNGEPETVFVRDVKNFKLTFLEKTLTPIPAVEVESPEVLLVSHTGAPGGTNPNYTMTSTAWCSQYFKPAFPADKTVVSWQVTRVNVRIGKAGTVPAGSTLYWNFQIRAATDPALQPTGPALGNETVRVNVGPLTAVVPSTATPPWMLTPITFTNVTGLDPAKGVCLVISQPLFGTTGYVGTQQNGTPMTADTHFMSSATAGVLWSGQQNTRDMYIQVYGKYRYLSTP